MAETETTNRKVLGRSAKASRQYTIDAAGRTLGRVASEAAKALMGKANADYTPHIRSDIKVTIEHAGKLRVSEKKRLQKIYTRYTGYPGGLRKESLGSLVGRKGNVAALKKAIRGMLPRNTMLVARLKNLSITE